MPWAFSQVFTKDFVTGIYCESPIRVKDVSLMLYRNKREYEQTLKNLENALQEGAQKAKASAGAAGKDDATEKSE